MAEFSLPLVMTKSRCKICRLTDRGEGQEETLDRPRLRVAPALGAWKKSREESAAAWTATFSCAASYGTTAQYLWDLPCNDSR